MQKYFYSFRHIISTYGYKDEIKKIPTELYWRKQKSFIFIWQLCHSWLVIRSDWLQKFIMYVKSFLCIIPILYCHCGSLTSICSREFKQYINRCLVFLILTSQDRWLSWLVLISLFTNFVLAYEPLQTYLKYAGDNFGVIFIC